MQTSLPATRPQIAGALSQGNLFQPATLLWRVYEIEAILRYAPPLGTRVLDLGCGDGMLTRTVSKLLGIAAPSSWIGIEPDPTDAKAARSIGIYDDVRCAGGDVTGLPDASVDGAFSNSVLEHIPDLKPVLGEVARVLRPGGRFVFTVPAVAFRAALGGCGAARWLARRRGESAADMVDRRLQHVRYPTPEEWSLLLAEAGLKLQSNHSYFPSDAVRAWERLSTWTGGLAFELFGRRAATRQVQRRLRLPSLERLVPRAVASAAVGALVAPHLGYLDDRASSAGGLLIVAGKPV